MKTTNAIPTHLPTLPVRRGHKSLRISGAAAATYIMSSAAYTRWETFAGVVGVITSIPIAVTLVMIHLPSRKIDSLFLTLASVQASLEETVEEGLLREHHIRSFRQQLIG